MSSTDVKRISPYPFRASTLNKHHGESDCLVEHAQFAGESIASIAYHYKTKFPAKMSEENMVTIESLSWSFYPYRTVLQGSAGHSLGNDDFKTILRHSQVFH